MPERERERERERETDRETDRQTDRHRQSASRNLFKFSVDFFGE